MIPSCRYARDRMGTRLMRAHMCTQLDHNDPMGKALCSHTCAVPAIFDQAVDTAVTHATADTDFIIRHTDYKRMDAILQVQDELLSIDEAPQIRYL